MYVSSWMVMIERLLGVVGEEHQGPDSFLPPGLVSCFTIHTGANRKDRRR